MKADKHRENYLGRARSHFQNLAQRTIKQDNDKKKCFSIANFLRFIRGAGSTTLLKDEQTEKQCSFAVPTYTLNIAIIKIVLYQTNCNIFRNINSCMLHII